MKKYFLIRFVAFVVLLLGLIRGNREAFKGENINKSMMTLGILALVLIAIVVGCILLLR